ncbi:MAG: SUMF1/EgtB/PvdO family nonheme iron enzyme [Chitinophagales bacterium]|nr:SUMF1/EgtB/PvdO family nonheme iron enzyme [Chitinophagales bacterium]
MKKHSIYILFASLLLLVASCNRGGDYGGQLLGSLDRPRWGVTIPYGMVYVRSGFLHIGQSDEDINNSMIQRAKSVSIQGFFMDETEITNNEYRQFVEWTRDSIAHTILGGDYMTEKEETGEQIINWFEWIDWNDPDVQEQLSSMYYPEDQRILGRKEIDPRQLNYVYYWTDFKEASRDVNRLNADFDRTTVIKSEVVNVYPDTLCWVHDFIYSYNEPWTRNYFWHPAFDNYPVVGVTWQQAMAFSKWRSRLYNDWRKEVGLVMEDEFRLPTEGEWEYAARGGREISPYPWGGPYMRNKKGCILANFKPGRGNYPDDGGMYTVKADAYFPNDYGIYCMAGNAAEWTSTAYFPNSYQFEHDLNPDIRYDAQANDPITAKRKVIRGGSWKDIAYLCQTGSRAFEYQDSARSYVGFRDIITYLGRSIDDR